MIYATKPGQGFNRMGELVDLGLKQKLISKSGTWYSYQGNMLGQGKEKTCQFLADNVDIASDIEHQVRAQLLSPSDTKERRLTGDDGISNDEPHFDDESNFNDEHDFELPSYEEE